MASIFKNALASVTGLGLILGLTTAPALAQATNGGFDDLSGDADNNEIFGGSGISLTDIMGNIRRSDGLNSDEFSRKSDRNIDEAAADFQRRQQETLDAQQGTAVENPVSEEEI